MVDSIFGDQREKIQVLSLLNLSLFFLDALEPLVVKKRESKKTIALLTNADALGFRSF